MDVVVCVCVVQSPADYYLRVMMREYQFDPASQMISVGEGDTVNIQVAGRRVEYRYAHLLIVVVCEFLCWLMLYVPVLDANCL